MRIGGEAHGEVHKIRDRHAGVIRRAVSVIRCAYPKRVRGLPARGWRRLGWYMRELQRTLGDHGAVRRRQREFRDGRERVFRAAHRPFAERIRKDGRGGFGSGSALGFQYRERKNRTAAERISSEPVWS